MKIKYLLLVSVLFFSGSIHGVTVISLGQTCSVSMALRFFNLRHEAYPFDWLVSPFSALYQVFEDDFKRFLQGQDLTVRQSDRYGVLDYYKFHFVHDFPTVTPNTKEAEAIEEGHMGGGVLRDDWCDFLVMIQEKYQRRINRLRTLLSSSEKVYLAESGN